MNSIKVQGKVTKLFQKQQITDNFAKREIWIEEVNEQYPNTYLVEFHNDRGALLDPIKEGQVVSMDVNLRGKYWQSKDGQKEGIAINLVGWKIEVVEQEKAPVAEKSSSSDEDDLPF